MHIQSLPAKCWARRSSCNQIWLLLSSNGRPRRIHWRASSCGRSTWYGMCHTVNDISSPQAASSKRACRPCRTLTTKSISPSTVLFSLSALSFFRVLFRHKAFVVPRLALDALSFPFPYSSIRKKQHNIHLRWTHFITLITGFETIDRPQSLCLLTHNLDLSDTHSNQPTIAYISRL